MNRSNESYPQMADAMEQVAALPHDSAFIDFIHQQRIASTVQYEQDATKQPFCLDMSLMHTMSADDFHNQNIVTIEELSLQSQTNEHATVIGGTVTLNQTNYVVEYSSDENKALLRERDHIDLPASIELTQQQLVELVLSGLILNHADDLDIEDVLGVYDQVPPGEDTLPTLLFALGGINGRASKTTTALLNSDSNVLAVKLTEEENPSDNAVENRLSVYSENELFTDTSHLVRQQRVDQQNSRRRNDAEYALRGYAEGDAGRASIDDLVNGLDAPRSSLTRYESSGDTASAREYALACIEFLSAYQRSKKSSS